MKGLPIAVFLACLILLGWNAGSAGIATSYVDPIGKVQAQDEATYGASSVRMAHQAHTIDGWLTPWFLNRLALYKPPILYWLSGVAIKTGSPIAWGFRIPSILAGALTATIVFLWLSRASSIAAALTGTILLLSSHLFFVMSRVGLMDALLASEITIAMYALYRDPALKARRWLWTFGVASGLSIMTKSTAGLLPILILFAFCATQPKRVTLPRILQALLIVFAVAFPWHLYQLIVHPKWFWNEYILTEQVAFGMGAKAQSTPDGAEYYPKRLFLLDPILLIAGIAALFKSRPRLFIAESQLRLLAMWIVVVLAGCAAFQYRNTSYLLPVFPALALLAASALPPRFAAWTACAAAALFVAKSILPGEPWGIPFAPESFNNSQALLRDYAAMHRENDLIIVNAPDQFYAADLELPVRYLYIGMQAAPTKAPLDFEYLGVTVTADQFNHLDQWRPIFGERLRTWGIDQNPPIAGVILAHDREEARELIENHPEADFLVDNKLVLAREKVQRP